MEETRARRWDFSVNPVTNRFGYALVLAILVNITLGNEALSLVVGVALFLLLTVIVTASRRRSDS